MNRPAHVVKGNVIAVSEHILFQVRELAFDAIEPRGVGRQPRESNVVASRPRQDLGRFVRREIIEHDVDAPGVVAPNRLEQLKKFDRALAPAEQPPDLARRDVVSGQKLAHAVAARVGGPLPMSESMGLKRSARLRAKLHRPELIDADHFPFARLGRLVEAFDGVFFPSNLGSVDCFHVLVRWSET